MGMESKRITKPGAKVITIFAGDLYGKSNYQDFGRYDEVDLAIAADAEATLAGSDRRMPQADHSGSQGRHSSSAARSSPK